MKYSIALTMIFIYILLFLFMPLYPQQPRSTPTTPVKKLKRYENKRTQSMDESIQEMLNLEEIRKQIEEKVKSTNPSSRNKK